MRQWAERSASIEGEYTVGLGIRTGSEKGKTRSSSVAPAYSARKTTSFDLPAPTSTPSSSKFIDGASSMRRGRELGAMRLEDSTAQDDERAIAPMSPLMEVGKTEAHPTEIPPLNLNENFAGLEIGGDGLEMRGSPEPLPARPDDPESIPPAEIPKETSTENDDGAAAPEFVRMSETREDTSSITRQTEYPNTGASSTNPFSGTETLLARISSRITNSDHGEKRNWLNKRSSLKKSEKMSIATSVQEKDKSGLGIGAAPGHSHSHSIGRTGSWGAVFDKMTGKKGEYNP